MGGEGAGGGRARVADGDGTKEPVVAAREGRSRRHERTNHSPSREGTNRGHSAGPLAAPRSDHSPQLGLVSQHPGTGQQPPHDRASGRRTTRPGTTRSAGPTVAAQQRRSTPVDAAQPGQSPPHDTPKHHPLGRANRRRPTRPVDTAQPGQSTPHDTPTHHPLGRANRRRTTTPVDAARPGQSTPQERARQRCLTGPVVTARQGQWRSCERTNHGPTRARSQRPTETPSIHPSRATASTRDAQPRSPRRPPASSRVAEPRRRRRG